MRAGVAGHVTHSDMRWVRAAVPAARKSTHDRIGPRSAVPSLLLCASFPFAENTVIAKRNAYGGPVRSWNSGSASPVLGDQNECRSSLRFPTRPKSVWLAFPGQRRSSARRPAGVGAGGADNWYVHVIAIDRTSGKIRGCYGISRPNASDVVWLPKTATANSGRANSGPRYDNADFWPPYTASMWNRAQAELQAGTQGLWNGAPTIPRPGALRHRLSRRYGWAHNYQALEKGFPVDRAASCAMTGADRCRSSSSTAPTTGWLQGPGRWQDLRCRVVCSPVAEVRTVVAPDMAGDISGTIRAPDGSSYWRSRRQRSEAGDALARPGDQRRIGTPDATARAARVPVDNYSRDWQCWCGSAPMIRGCSIIMIDDRRYVVLPAMNEQIRRRSASRRAKLVRRVQGARRAGDQAC